MKGPGIQEYLNYLENLKQSSHNEGLKYIDISSRDLHSIISPNHATMPTCCQAIYKLMLEGDEILDSPRGQTGFGSRLLVRYYVDQLEDRASYFPSKKRGRPLKTEEEKRKARMLKTNRSTDDLKELIMLWLNERGWTVTSESNNLRAIKDDQLWIINVQGSQRGRKQTLPVKINSILNDIVDEDAYYSVAFNDSASYRKQWNDVPKVLKTKLKVSVLFADKNGKVLQFR
ncbi:MAG: AT hook domain-containing protein [Erysipelotrichaceae bacterium]|nr:AT hook domain-containing protein [Erysipelotrichaceae bacterium]